MMTSARTAHPRPFVVVLAEDEALIRMMAADVLTSAGYQVIEAEHGDHALAVLHSKARDIHILFTDIHMPGSMDGLALAHHSRRNWPWIALLIASGRARPAQEDLPAGSRFLAKPYDPDHMVSHVRELIAAQ